MMFYVYKITNLVNEKVYIGKTNDVAERFRHHSRLARSGSDVCPKFYNSIRKHGIENFSQPEILGTFEDEETAYQAEAQFIEEFNSIQNGLNTVPGGTGTGSGDKNPRYGIPHTDEVKKLISEKVIASFEFHPPRKGFHMSDGSKTLLSESMKEFHQTHPNSFAGRQHTDETKRLLSEIRKQFYAENPNPLLGRKLSEETRQKQREKRAENFQHFSEINTGSKNPNAKLTEEDVVSIKHALMEGKSDKELADTFHISEGKISLIRLGKAWTHAHVDGFVPFEREPKLKCKLTEEQVIEIIRLIPTGKTATDIAKIFGVSIAMICSIKNGKSWKHLPR